MFELSKGIPANQRLEECSPLIILKRFNNKQQQIKESERKQLVKKKTIISEQFGLMGIIQWRCVKDRQNCMVEIFSIAHMCNIIKDRTPNCNWCSNKERRTYLQLDVNNGPLSACPGKQTDTSVLES